jgi:hypothetical protein
MKGNELMEIIDRLYKSYSDGPHFIVTNAEFRGDAWFLTVTQAQKEPEDKPEVKNDND